MKKGNLGLNLKLSVPPPDELSKFLTESGTFKDGDLLVNNRGLRIVDRSDKEIAPLIQPSDNQISLVDFDAVKVIGKGNGGVVRLVQHKWTEQFFALKTWTSTQCRIREMESRNSVFQVSCHTVRTCGVKSGGTLYELALSPP